MDVAVEVVKVGEPAGLLCWYEGEHAPQPVTLRLDLESGELTADYQGAISGIPRRQATGIVLTAAIPPLTAEAANELLEEVAPLAQRVLSGASVDWDGRNQCGQLDHAGAAAWDELVRVVEARTGDGADVVETLDIRDEFATPGDLADYGLTAASTDEELAEIQAAVRADMESGARVVVVTGLDVLNRHRDDMRNHFRAELADVADRIATLTERRNDLIRQCARFDGSRAVGTLARMSHTKVQRIAKQQPQQ